VAGTLQRQAGSNITGGQITVIDGEYRTDATETTASPQPRAQSITVVKTGFARATASVQVATGSLQEVFVELLLQPTVEETVTVVAATRTDKRLEDQSMRVEVLARDNRAASSENVAQRDACRMIRGLNPMLELQPERLPERRRTEGQMTIAIEKDGGIASLTRSVIDSNAADDPR
jgi:hypothetical protein